MDIIDKLTEIFKHFPGIGPRQAKRFVYFLMSRNQSYIDNLTKLIEEMRAEVNVCETCFRYFIDRSKKKTNCELCLSPNRDDKILMLIARDIDMENIEKSHSYNGRYFVLGGTVPIPDQSPEKFIRLKELLARIKSLGKSGQLKEIILGLNLNPESEHTGRVVVELLSPTINQFGIKISHLGRGLSTGTELEYSDTDTIKSALENRK